MTPAALAEYLHQNIPLSRGMDVTVEEAGADQVVLTAPLAPNLNMHGTMFGGSLATLALMAAWSVLHLRLEQLSTEAQLVVRRSEVEYMRPVSGAAKAVARLDGAEWNGFVQRLERRGKARINLLAEVLFDEGVAARLKGEFVATLTRNR